MTRRVTQCTTLKLETGSEREVLHCTFVLFHVHIYIEPETLLRVPSFAENPDKGPASQEMPTTDLPGELHAQSVQLKVRWPKSYHTIRKTMMHLWTNHKLTKNVRNQRRYIFETFMSGSTKKIDLELESNKPVLPLIKMKKSLDLCMSAHPK